MNPKILMSWLGACAGALVIATLLLFPGTFGYVLKAAGEVVVGHVYYPNGNPAANVNVELHLADGSISYRTDTLADGSYAFSQTLPSGLHWGVEITAPTGYNKPTNVQGSDFVYQSGDATRTVDFTLVAAPKTISGRVTNLDGTPVIDADIDMYPTGTNSGKESVHTFADGTYTKSLHSGKWFVNAVANLGEQNVRWINENPPVEIAFSDDDSIETITQNFVVTPATGNLKVILLNSDGSKLTSSNFVADIDIRRADGIGTTRKVSSVDSSLNIYLTPGIYSMSAYHQDLTGKSFDPAKTTFAMTENGSVDLGTVLAEVNSAHLKGKVIDGTSKGIGNMMIQAMREGGSEMVQTNTNSDGTFDFVVGAGKWIINFQPGPGQNFTQVTPVSATVVNGQTVSGLTIQFKTLDRIITGSVVNSAGTKVTDFVGSAYVRTADKKSQVSAPVVDGAYTIQFSSADVPGNKVVIGVTAAPGADYAGGREANVTFRGTSANQNITVAPYNATISGRLVLPSGATAVNNGSEIEIVAVDTKGNFTSTVVSDSTGTYSLPIAAGTWLVDYEIADPENTDGLINRPSGLNSVIIKAGQTKSVNFRIVQGKNTVTGTVTDANGVAVPSVPVILDNRISLENNGTINSNDIITVTSETNENGIYSAEVPNGTYQVSIGDTPFVGTNQITPDAKNITISGNKTATMDFNFENSDATIAGTVKFNNKSDAGGTVTAFTDDGAQATGNVNSQGQYSISVNSKEKWHVIATDLSGKKLLRSGQVDLTTKSGRNGVNLSYKDSGIAVPAPVTKTFAANAGGTVSLPDGTIVNLPPYALDVSGNVSLTVSPTIDIDPTSLDQPATLAYEVKGLNASGEEVKQLNRPATITLPYKESTVASNGLRENSLATKYWNSNTQRWETEGSGGVVDKSANTATITSAHLTKFAITGTSKSLPKPTSATVKSRSSTEITWTVSGSNFSGKVTAKIAGKGSKKVVVKSGKTLEVTFVRKNLSGAQYDLEIINGNGRSATLKNVKSR